MNVFLFFIITILLTASFACSQNKTESFWNDTSSEVKKVSEVMGISSHMKQSSKEDSMRNQEMARYEELGIHFVRQDLLWNELEPEKDRLDFSKVETQVELVHEAGLQFIAILAYETPWAMTSSDTDSINILNYAHYAGAMAQHFCGRIQYFEIWNEPNLKRFWSKHPNPQKYAELLKASYQAIKKACPQAAVISGGLSSFTEERLFEPWWFLKDMGMYHQDICGNFDILGLHPYTFLQNPPPEKDLVFSNTEIVHSQKELVRIAREILDEHGCPEKPIFFTEMGWPSYVLSQEEQAIFYQRSFLLALSDSIDAFIWYTFWDENPQSPTIRPHEHYFGVMEWPGIETEIYQEKTVYHAMKAIKQILGDSFFQKDISADLLLPNDVYALLFASSSSKTLVLWYGRDYPDENIDGVQTGGINSSFKIQLPVQYQEIILYDFLGKQTAKFSNQSEITITISRHPQFAVTPQKK